VRVRLQDSEVERLKAEAADRGIKVSTLVRERLFQEHVKRVFE
jgi:predicted DNA binding CopG/RHH family protein